MKCIPKYNAGIPKANFLKIRAQITYKGYSVYSYKTLKCTASHVIKKQIMLGNFIQGQLQKRSEIISIRD